mmetsp:Transcript_29109/g.55192  ORF Transcript_29109/g.55192 Transcript_29109/m.55192 type:complete len:396 (+) Transcript_29109:589-1776(+)
MKLASLPKLAAIAGLSVMPSATNARELQTADEICVEGYVMDFFCIERGTLFDNPSVVSLAEPERHSVHCLVDVAPCLASPYEVLFALPEASVTSDIKHARGWRLDDSSKDQIIALARGVGRIAASPTCTTCTEDSGGSLDNGFHAGMLATVVTPSDGTNPAVITINRVEHSFPDTPFCGVNGVGNTGLEASVPSVIITASGSNFEKAARAHGALMLIGWGWLLPSGVIVAKLFRHRPNGFWFKIHRPLQMLGLACTIAGFAIALVNFDVFSGKGSISHIHGSLGATVMTFGMLQPLNAFIRPHPNQEGKERNIKRTIWEIVHKGGGYGSCLLAVATISIGTTLLPNVDDQKKYQMAYGIGAGCLLLFLAVFGIYDKSNYQEVVTLDAKPEDHVDP